VNSYKWIDAKPFPGNNFYRIKWYDLNGTIKYSQVVKVDMEGKIIPFTIYPNPVKESNIHLQFANQPAGNYEFSLINSNGQLVWSNELFISNDSKTKELMIDRNLPPGVYSLQIGGSTNTIETHSFIIEK
jgi:hypothetical protein